jgi:pimeloyl-ACP methyl ester carboxylesterase
VESVLAVDLPGRGAHRDAKPLETISLADFVDHLVREIESRNLHNVVLVGHSLAGITIPRAAARIPERIKRLIYLSTSNPPAGQSIADLMQHPLSPLSRGVDFKEMFCNDLDDETTAWLHSKLEPEPPGPISERVPPVTLPPGITSTYILLERDQALPPQFQREQAAHANANEIVPFDAGHSAFLSRPLELAELLLRYA